MAPIIFLRSPSLFDGSQFSITPLYTQLAMTDSPPPPVLPENHVILPLPLRAR